MYQRANLVVANPSTASAINQVRRTGSAVGKRICEALEAFRRRTAAADLLAELSGLSDAQLERRGIARGDLHRLVSEMT